MTTRLQDFMARIARETYPEPYSEGHTYILSQMAPRVAEMLPKGASILDVGSGPGVALKWFTEHGFKPVGVDVNQDNIAACEAQGFTVLNQDQNDLPASWHNWDCVWARHVLEHSIAPYWTLTEFNRVLKPDGVLYVEVPAPGTPCLHETNQNHYSVLGAEMWMQLINRAGFGIVIATGITGMTSRGEDKYLAFIARKL